jgi:hypothetical protein
VYFSDLSPYVYFLAEEQSSPAVNVGWLDGATDYPTGSMEANLRGEIRRLCLEEVVNRCMGYHGCTLCPPRPRSESVPSGAPKFLRVGSTEHEEWVGRRDEEEICARRWAEGKGNGEIRVTGDGVVYVAPELLADYVETHQYLPPPEFLEAVRSRLKAR